MNDAYRRWRHRRGFGVHSPLAYRLLCDVLQTHRGYTYYAYDAIAAATPRQYGARRHAERVHRLAARLPHCRADVLSPLTPGLRAALDSAPPTPGAPCRLLLADAPDADAIVTLAAEAAMPHRAIFVTGAPSHAIERIAGAMTCGTAFVAPHGLLALTDPNAAKTIYSITI